MSKTKRYSLLVLLIIAVSLYYCFDWRFLYKKDVIHIALAGPITGKYSSTGKCMVQGASLFFDEINRTGGINGKKIVLDIFDDKNKAELAQSVALQIAKANKYIAVIGHFLSDCSETAGQIYKKYQIPVISPTSSNKSVTKDNEWFFRNVHDNFKQCSFLASYIKKSFPNENVSIIYENNNYGKNTSKIFEKSITDLGIQVKYKWEINPTDKKLDEKLRRVAFDILMKKNAGLIFIACYAESGIRLIKMIRDNLIKNQIIAPASLASEIFQEGFSKLQKEKNNPGFYTDGLIVSTPIINDTVNEKGQQFNGNYIKRFGMQPGWHAALTYETAMLLAKALKNSQIICKSDTLSHDRRIIRDYLLSMSSATNAFEGLSDSIFFNSSGDVQRPLFTGIYKKQHIISTSIQYQPIHNIFEVSDFNKALQKKRIVLLNGQFMYKINIVYTGIDVIDIYNVDFQDATFSAKFYLWFRFQGKIDPQNIHFINSSGLVKIEPVKKTIMNDMTYSLYYVDGSFKMDSLPKVHTFNEHVLGVSFRHKELTRDYLIYVTDIRSMRGNRGDMLVEKMQQAQVLNPALGWGITDCYFFQNTSKCSSNGEPKYLNNIDRLVKYSRYNVGIRINKKEFAFRHMIPDEYIHHMFIFSLFFLVCVSFVISKAFLTSYSRSIWFMQAIFSFSILVSLEAMLDMNFSNHFESFQVNLLDKMIRILWWITPSVLLCIAIKRFIRNPLEIKTGRIIPDIVVRFIDLFIYLLTFFGIIAFVFDQKITSLLATSGVFAMIIGLAVQINISNFFSGIALNLETPFKIGDWVKIGSQEPGKVIDITWRTTRLQTIDDSIMSVPNSVVSESLIHNYHYPSNVFRSWFTIHIDSDIPPERFKKILIESLEKIDCICDNPSPSIYFKGLTGWSAKYLVSFSITDYSSRLRTIEAVWTQVWHSLQKENITFSLLRKDFYMNWLNDANH